MIKRKPRLVPPAPRPSGPNVTAAMRGNVREGTKPEMAVRRVLTRMGLRYRLYAKDLPGKPDIVFRRRRIVIFVHGCFWHQHADARCRLKAKPRSNTGYWNAKLARNVSRDRAARQALRRLGWKVLTIWECEAGAPAKVLGKLRHIEQFRL